MHVIGAIISVNDNVSLFRGDSDSLYFFLRARVSSIMIMSNICVHIEMTLIGRYVYHSADLPLQYNTEKILRS